MTGASAGHETSQLPLALAAGAAALAALALVIVAAGAAMLAALLARPLLSQNTTYGVSQVAVADIPPEYLRTYEAAAQRYGLDWSILAAVGKVECDHGRDPDPSCTREGSTNAAGAGGPAQFLASTWQAYGVDGDGDGVRDRWNPIDAIFGMANYLKASGAPRDYHAALFAYNHAEWYVAEVQRIAAGYRAAITDAAPQQLSAGSRATLSPRDGHVALIPADAPVAVRSMLEAGNELQQLPYGAAGHPDPRNAASQDCSSTVNYVLYRAGLRSISEILRVNPVAQSYPAWGASGPGRWVSIYATSSPSDHVFIVIAGLRLDTSHRGTDIGPNRNEDGPRWRILDHIPTWARWAVRHPPGM